MPDDVGDGDDGLAFVHADWRGHWDIQRGMGTAVLEPKTQVWLWMAIEALPV